MCPTVYGRVQTRWAIIIIPAILATIASLITGHAGWIVLIGVYFVLGTALDTIFYPNIISWQPPWLTFALTVGEFILVYLLAQVLKIQLVNPSAGANANDVAAVVLFWVAWVVAIWTKVAILPLLSLSWIENAGEFRQTGWSVAPQYQPLPITAFTAPMEGSGPPPLAREFSSVRKIPDELRNLPSPSGVRRIPTGA
jgi:hypothetical protein